MYPGIHFQIFPGIKVLPKIFPSQVWAKNFFYRKLGENFLKAKGHMKKLTEREWEWLWEYVRRG